MAPQRIERGTACALHQVIARNPRGIDRVAVHGAHRGGRIDLGG